jgi:hypothetical protein
MTKPIDSLKTITRYIEAKKPTTLTEAEHMLNLISVIADETIREIEAEPPFGLSAEALAKFRSSRQGRPIAGRDHDWRRWDAVARWFDARL